MSMQSASIAELSARARDVFRQIVESYVETGSPIGSRTISKLSGLGLSAASIRNVMQDLEEMGLLASPHTSAGRIPTETGLRSEEHTSELQSLMRISYAVFCSKKQIQDCTRTTAINNLNS